MALDHSCENLNLRRVNAAVQPTILSVSEYLTEEETSLVRHEYVRGYVYAMAGASKAHNEICLNLAELLRAHLRGGRCRTSMADVKLRPHFDDELFYYPDLMVTCDPRHTSAFQPVPKVNRRSRVRKHREPRSTREVAGVFADRDAR